MKNKKRPNYKFAMAKIAGIASAIDFDPSSQPANIHDEAMREIKRIAHEALGDNGKRMQDELVEYCKERLGRGPRSWRSWKRG